jgi:TolA-binding protein
MGNMCVVMSDYKRAVNYFSKTVARCPEDPAAEEAEFEIAQCYEKLGNNRAAIAAYDAFVEKYKGSRRARTAIRAADILRTS